MIKIIGYRQKQNGEGKSFIALELQGGVEFVQSQETGRFYATARRCSMPSTFDEETAKSLVGSEMAGKVERVATEPYNYQIPGTTETVMLNYRYEYQPEHAVKVVSKLVVDPEDEEEFEEEEEPVL